MGLPELPLLLSLLSEELTPELDVTSPTLLEPSTSPRGRLRLMPTTLEDTELDTPVLDTLVWDTLVSDTPVSDTPVLDTMLLALPPPLPLSASPVWPILLSPLLEVFTLQLDDTSPTLLELSMLPENQMNQFDYVVIDIMFLINITKLK